MEPIKNPWQKLSSREIYSNPWITLIEDQIINPGGSPGIYGKVLFKNVAIGIIPLDSGLNTWLVGQYRYPLDEYSWEIPMGGGPKGKSILDSAQRELKEETGLIAESWTELMKIHTSNSVTDETGYVFLARELQEGIPEFEETERLEIKKLPLEKAIKMVMDGMITDSISVAGLLRTAKEFKL
jgi:8-oxo-dGDP phosphatase